ncbi:MAG: cytochrome C oxidase subunit IV family protein [Planctomycetes bacterium]|nr:cytochrome C oxidase subunit IV family protein [Planctomycetota bacterium]
MSDHAHDSDHAHHVLSVGLLAKVFIALLALTALTVWTGNMSIFGMDFAIAMVIATVKATLVCMIFMHLKYDRPFNGFMFLLSVGFVGVFLTYTLTDAGEYQEEIDAFTGPPTREVPEHGPVGEKVGAH